jgi:hypothetical protein
VRRTGDDARRIAAAAAAIAVLTASAVGCAPKAPDYQSIWTTSAKRTATTTSTEKPVPFAKYLEGIGVVGEQVAPKTLPDLTVSIPTPPGWGPYTNPKISPNTEMIAKSGTYPTAMLMVFKLRGDFDPAEAIKHGNADAQLLQNFTQLDASNADFNGFPSSMIQGSYDLEGTRLHSFNRMVIATGSPPGKQRYLVQLTITSRANEAVAQSSEIEAIMHGLVVAAK